MNYKYLGAAIVSWLTFLPLTISQVRPPNFSPDALPDTAFSCEDKVTGGYYADLEADCQLFHVCVQVSEYEFQDFHFLCPNDTVFDQQHLVCTNWFEVDCHTQLAFFTNHWGIKSKGDDDVDKVTPEDVNDNAFLGQNPSGNRLRSGGRGQIESLRSRPAISRFPDYYDYEEDDDARGGGPSHEDTPSRHNIVHPPITTTPIPLGFTVTARNNKQQRNFFNEDEDDDTKFDPFDRPPKSNLRGRRPRVKSDIKIKHANSRKKFNKTEKKFKTTGSRKVKLNRKDRKKIEFVEPEEDNEPIRSPFTGPQLRPDGRSPRVKANIIAELQNKGAVETTTNEPFLEAFFASPSTISPIVFTGSPSPDPFGSGSTSRPFFAPFAPTVKSSRVSSHAPLTFSISDTSFSAPTIPPTGLIPPQETREQGTNNIHETETNRFVSRPNPSRFNNRRKISPRGRNRVVVTTTENAPFVEIGTNNRPHENVETLDVNLSTQAPRSGLISARQKPHVKSDVVLSKRNRGKKFSRVRAEIGHQRDCSNPFNCPPTQRAPGGRARVKSNVRAKTRNFWQKPLKKRVKHRGKFSKEFGVGTSGFRRNGIRRRKGRKQVVAPIENDISNDIEDDFHNDIDATQQSFETIPSQFVPTPRPIIGKENKDTFSGKDLFETDLFDGDFFEEDLVFASSTVSPVVFRGSPTPSFGFFSSPKPQFNDIGAHIDLGAKKHPGRNSVFISSTISNKIFIGSREEETTKPTLFQEVFEPVDENVAVTEEPAIVGDSITTKRSFPSFPVKFDPSSPVKFEPSPKQKFNLKRPSFSRKKNKEPEKPLKNDLLSQILSVLDPTLKEEEPEKTFVPTAPIETTSTSTTTTVSETETPEKASRFPLRRGRGPRVKSNLLFNKRNRPHRRKFGVKKDLFVKTTTASPTTIEQITTTTTTKVVETSSDDILETIAPTNLPKEPEPTSASSPTTLEDLLLVTNPRRKASKGLFSRQRDTFFNKNKFNNNKRKSVGLLRSSFRKTEKKIDVPSTTEAEQTTKAVPVTEEMVKEKAAEEISTEASTELITKESTTEEVPHLIDLKEPDNLSVESLFEDDDEEDEIQSNDIIVTKTTIPPRDKFTAKFGFQNRRPRTRVKGALFGKKSRKVQLGDNGIRVEFKKADIPSETSSTEKNSSLKPKFRVRPDGRKPRVKSNIRAKLSNFGKSKSKRQKVTFFKPPKTTFVEPAEPLPIIEDEIKIEEAPTPTETDIEEEPSKPLEETDDGNSEELENQNETADSSESVEPQVNLSPPPSGRRPRVKSNIRAGLSNRRNRGSFPFKRAIQNSLLQNLNFGNVGAAKDISHLFRKPKKIQDVSIPQQETQSLPQTVTNPPQDPNTILLQFVKNKNKEVEQSVSTTAQPIPEYTITSISSTVHEKLSAFRALQKQTKTANKDIATPPVEAATRANLRKHKRKVRQEDFYDYQYYQEFHHSPDSDQV